MSDHNPDESLDWSPEFMQGYRKGRLYEQVNRKLAYDRGVANGRRMGLLDAARYANKLAQGVYNARKSDGTPKLRFDLIEMRSEIRRIAQAVSNEAARLAGVEMHVDQSSKRDRSVTLVSVKCPTCERLMCRDLNHDPIECPCGDTIL